MVALDAAALIRTALGPRELGWLQKSAGLAELERTSALLLRTLEQNFPVHHGPSADSTQSRERGRLRYERALLRLREADIPTREDPEAGAREYVELRVNWEPGIEAVDLSSDDLREIDAAASTITVHGDRYCEGSQMIDREEPSLLNAPSAAPSIPGPANLLKSLLCGKRSGTSSSPRAIPRTAGRPCSCRRTIPHRSGGDGPGHASRTPHCEAALIRLKDLSGLS